MIGGIVLAAAAGVLTGGGGLEVRPRRRRGPGIPADCYGDARADGARAHRRPSILRIPGQRWRVLAVSRDPDVWLCLGRPPNPAASLAGGDASRSATGRFRHCDGCGDRDGDRVERPDDRLDPGRLSGVVCPVGVVLAASVAAGRISRESIARAILVAGAVAGAAITIQFLAQFGAGRLRPDPGSSTTGRCSPGTMPPRYGSRTGSWTTWTLFAGIFPFIRALGERWTVSDVQPDRR